MNSKPIPDLATAAQWLRTLETECRELASRVEATDPDKAARLQAEATDAAWLAHRYEIRAAERLRGTS